MDSRDRLFGEIAVRLELITREQLGRCIAEQQSGSQQRIGEIAVELGFVSSDEADLIRLQQERILEKRRSARKPEPSPAGGIVEQRPKQHDPRAATGPLAPHPRRRSSWRPSPNSLKLEQADGTEETGAPGAATAPGATARPPASEDGLLLNMGDMADSEPSKAPQGSTRPVSLERTVAGVGPEAFGELRTTGPNESLELGPGGTFVGVGPTTSDGGPPRIKTGPTGTILKHGAPGAADRERTAPTRLDPGDLRNTYLGRALAEAIDQGASDLHGHSGAPMLIRVDGQLVPLGGSTPVDNDKMGQAVAEVLTETQWSTLEQHGEVDLACEIAGLGRFRVNAYRQQRGLDIVFRIIPAKPPTLQQLGLPDRLARLTDFRTGLVLCTGPSGCGKSTTLAALLGLLAQDRPDHILTIENPVEHVFDPGRALVNQRQVGDHTRSFARALRAALREDPDIIAITELRDRETMALAISAAETGHLVLGTLHTSNAAQTINRIVSSFPADEQEQIRVMLSESLRAVLSQRLVPLAAGRGRVPAIELLMVNVAVSNLIRDNKTFQLPSVMQTGKAAGMITLDDSLAQLVSSGQVSKQTAGRFAVKKERFA